MRLVNASAARGEYFVQTVDYETNRGKRYSIYFALPPWVRDPVSQDHAYVLGASIAFVLGEDYDQDLPVTETTARNVSEALDIWHRWHPYKRRVKLSAPTVPDPASRDEAELNEACFFTAGIDSLFTAYKLGPAVTALSTVLHVDPYDQQKIREETFDVAEYFDFADRTGRVFIPVATNLMTVVPEYFDAWAYLSHGAGFSSIAHALSGEVKRIHISSSAPYYQLMPWGSHPETDKRFSSSSVEVNHFGADWERWDKTVDLVTDSASLSVLNVCGKGKLPPPYANCSKCQKCTRSMMMMDLAGVNKDEATTFDWSYYDLTRIATLHLRSKNEFNSMHDVRNKAIELGRDDIVRTIDKMLKGAEKYLFLTNWEFYLRQRFKSVVWMKPTLRIMRGGVYRALGLRRSL
ncbi:MAG: hypothetical protein RIB03_04230 [Henriciella sp.]|uniref:hypothetical protein n=1 Tax=Henriciella sp. TaxID=1968823 RepID=UPI0032ED9C71